VIASVILPPLVRSVRLNRNTGLFSGLDFRLQHFSRLGCPVDTSIKCCCICSLRTYRTDRSIPWRSLFSKFASTASRAKRRSTPDIAGINNPSHHVLQAQHSPKLEPAQVPEAWASNTTSGPVSSHCDGTASTSKLANAEAAFRPNG